ncbi:dephospho-CoA kinase [Cyanobium sp. CH-040]|nr:dephospho-CoA kinase [Cyanobium sp. CH-040]
MEAEPDAGLDGEAVAICRQLAGVLFPWDITRSLELALLKTFCLPSISGLLSRTGEFSERPRKRYDDTGLMVAELLRHGPDSPAGAAVISRMNRIHGAYAISNDDFLYVLSTFVAEPIRWLERHGWRPLGPAEQQALFRFWRHVGARMGIGAIPASLEGLLALNTQVERELFRPAESNRIVSEATLAMLLDDWPAPLRPAVRGVLQAVVEPELAAPLGWPAAPGALRSLVRTGLRLRSRLLNRWQRLRPPRGSRFYSERPTPSYGERFRLEQLGPPALLERLNRPRWTGRQRRIGLTGGIASGKSTVGRLLAARGLPLLDADAYAREALAPGSAGARAVLARYGERVRAAGGAEAIDRAALGAIVFADAAERRWLEQLVHPIVRARFEAELQRLAAAPAVVLMIPLLFEAGLEDLCSEVWLVDCDAGQQLQRLMARDGLSEGDARARIAAQWPLARKRPLADRLIDNRGGAEQLVAESERVFARSR